MDEPPPLGHPAGPGEPVSESHAASSRLLRRNRRLATGLLLAMAALFVVSHLVPGTGFWIGWARALSEAAVVGGLADWFAVTALFRRPLGLPIPHTAIVPRNKDRIGEGLGGFVERNFLDPHLVADRVRRAEPAARLLRWLKAPGTAETIAGRVVAILPALLRTGEDRELRAFLAEAVGRRMRGLEISPALGRMVGLLLRSGQHEPLLERLVATAHDYVERNETRFEDLIGERTGWWVPRSIDRRVARAVAHGVRELLADLLSPASRPRIRLEMAIEELAHDLQHDEDTRRKVEEAKLRLLDHPDVQEWLAGLWDVLRGFALEDLDKGGDARTRTALVALVRSLADTLEKDAAMRQRIDRGAVALTMRLVMPWRSTIGRFIAEVVRSWDTRTVTDRLEQAVGSDLQYVRISGTLVAALVGSALYLATVALG